MAMNSYIFLKKDEHKSKKNIEKDVLYVQLGESFLELFNKNFELKHNYNTTTMLNSVKKGKFLLEINNDFKKINYSYYSSNENYYLDISFDSKSKKERIIVFNEINSKILGKNSFFIEKYIPINSYDYVSAEYGKELFNLLNEFERSLRVLLLNIYTNNFSVENFFVSIPENIVDTINFNTRYSSKNNQKIRYYDKVEQAFYLLTLNQVENILFTEYQTSEEKALIDDILIKEADLTKLSDSKLRELINISRPKCSWDRFFYDKITCESFEDKLSEIRKIRNSVAHCKLITTENYNMCKKNLNYLTPIIKEAIENTHKKDFFASFLETYNKNFNSLLTSIVGTIYPTISLAAQNMINSLSNQNLNPIYDSCKLLAQSLADINYDTINDNSKILYDSIESINNKED